MQNFNSRGWGIPKAMKAILQSNWKWGKRDFCVNANKEDKCYLFIYPDIKKALSFNGFAQPCSKISSFKNKLRFTEMGNFGSWTRDIKDKSRKILESHVKRKSKEATSQKRENLSIKNNDCNKPKHNKQERQNPWIQNIIHMHACKVTWVTFGLC